MPQHYQPRPEVETQLRDMLLHASGMLALTASFDGPAGIGKTTLAIVACHDGELQQHFSDGVGWVSFGRERTGAEVLATLAVTLGVPRTAEAGSLCSAISARLAGRRLLLVLDDICTKEQAGAFGTLTSGSEGLLVQLITTRNAELATSYPNSLQLEQLSDAASLRLLTSLMGGGASALRTNQDDADLLVRSCRGNAAMLRSVAGLCRNRGLKDAVRYLTECRAKQQQSMPGGAEYGTLYAALEGSLANLSAGLARRATMLAVFPEDTSIPLAVIGQLWGSHEELESEIKSLEDWQLVDVDWKKRLLTLIDLHHDYLRCRGKSELAGWHGQLLSGCGRRAVGVNVGDVTDAYWGNGQRWVYHLCEGGAAAIDAVTPTLTDVNFTAIGLQPQDGDHIARLVRGCTALTNINIGFNNLDEQGALSILRAARQHDKMTSLGVGSCQIREFGAKQIADYLGFSMRLTSLNLEYNLIDTEGGKCIASALSANALLTSLNISENFLGPEGAKAIASYRILLLRSTITGHCPLVILLAAATHIDSNYRRYRRLPTCCRRTRHSPTSISEKSIGRLGSHLRLKTTCLASWRLLRR